MLVKKFFFFFKAAFEGLYAFLVSNCAKHPSFDFSLLWEEQLFENTALFFYAISSLPYNSFIFSHFYLAQVVWPEEHQEQFFLAVSSRLLLCSIHVEQCALQSFTLKLIGKVSDAHSEWCENHTSELTGQCVSAEM